MEDTKEDVKSTFPLPKREERRPLLKDLNNFLMCRLCGGYLVEATTIVECFHTYCRSCIVQFLQNSKFCPICEVQVNKMKPLLSLRPDKVIQRLVYKTVPGLYKNEIERRRKYLLNSEEKSQLVVDEDLRPDEYFFAPEEPISISLEYVEENRINKFENLSPTTTNLNTLDFSEKSGKITYKRYLQCPAAVKIEHIHKFIKLKYNLQSNHEVEISYDNVRLPNYLTLMDTAYMFSWNREKPMRLCYQIFERTFIQVPISVSNEISDDFVPVKNSSYLRNSVSSTNSMADSTNSKILRQNSQEMNNTSSTLNLKRKSELTTKSPNVYEKSDDKFDFREPSVKIPRIESSKLDAKVKNDETRAKFSTIAADIPMKNAEDSTTTNSVSSTVSDNFADYEQDIEEVDEDEDEDEDEDDEDRLRISQLSEEETVDDKQDDSSENLIIDTSDVDKAREDKNVDKKSTYKRKNKKSKHHHHRKHRHHERKKAGPQATIVHSPDTDIMKLKFKLSNHTSDTKHHKQNKRKHKKNSDTYLSFSSSSSVSSVTTSSPELNSISRADEDSSHSRTSEMSIDSTEIKGDTMSTVRPKSERICFSPLPTKVAVESELNASPNAKEKVVQIRNFNKIDDTRLSPVPVKVSSEYKVADKQELPSAKEKLSQMRTFRPRNLPLVKAGEQNKQVDFSVKNDDNNNDKPSAPVHSIEPDKSEAAVTEVRRPTSSSALTVSKLTAAEMKKEQEKLQFLNGSKEEPPALEITVVPAKGLASAPSPTLPPDNSPALTIRPSKPHQKPFKPIPAAIPLSQYQKMKSSDHSLPKLTEHNLPKSLTITPHMVTNSQRNMKLNTDVVNKKLRDLPGMKQSITISLSENDSALDLSGPPKRPVVITQNKKITTNGVRMNGIPTHYSTMNNSSSNENKRSPDTYAANKTNNVQYPVSTSTSTSVSSTPSKNSKIATSYTPTILRSQVPMRMNTMKMNNKVHNLPQLNEIKTGPPLKPGPNQNVRSIPNLNTILQRQQLVSNFAAMPPDMAMMHRVMSSAYSFGNLKKNSDKCPPAMPINKAYLDRTNLMVTK